MARRYVSVKKARDLTPADRKVLYSMSFKSRGTLLEWLNEAVKEDTDDQIILCKEAGKVVGWGMRLNRDRAYYKQNSVGFWTRKTHRQQGIGGKMVAKAMTLGPIKTHPHDRASYALFDKFEV